MIVNLSADLLQIIPQFLCTQIIIEWIFSFNSIAFGSMRLWHLTQSRPWFIFFSLSFFIYLNSMQITDWTKENAQNVQQNKKKREKKKNPSTKWRCCRKNKGKYLRCETFAIASRTHQLRHFVFVRTLFPFISLIFCCFGCFGCSYFIPWLFISIARFCCCWWCAVLCCLPLSAAIINFQNENI